MDCLQTSTLPLIDTYQHFHGFLELFARLAIAEGSSSDLFSKF